MTVSSNMMKFTFIMKLLNIFLVQIVFLAVISSKMLVNSSNQTDDVDGNRVEPTTVTAIYTMVEEQQSTMPAALENVSNSSTIINETDNQNTLRDRTHVSYYPNYKERPPKNDQEAELGLPSQTAISGAAGSDIVKPTKYHYYPHNQHIYLLPECAVQQVCNVVYIRLNYTQPLCACPSRYREPCSASLNSDDLHTTELSTDPKGKVLTLIKTCEPVADMRLCRNPQDWSLLTLQNIRTGKSHYLVICRCPETSILEGPLSHDQPTYASVPGIRVYGMICVNDPKQTITSSESINLVKRKVQSPFEYTRSTRIGALSNDLPWKKIDEIVKNHLMD